MIVFITILLFFGAGISLQRLFHIPKSLPLSLNTYVINVALPATIILSIPKLTLDHTILFPIASYWLGLLVLWFITAGLCKRFQWGKEIQCVMFIMTGLGNTSFLGFPMINAFFSEEAMAYAVIYDQLGSFLSLSIVATIVIAAFSGVGKKPSMGSLIFKVMRFPPFIVLVTGLLLPIEIVTEPLIPFLKVLSQTIVPCTMISIGLMFKFRIDRQYAKPLSCILAVKMLLLPIMVAVGGAFFTIEPLAYTVTIFEAAMPPMVTGAAILISAGIATELAVATLGVGTLLSFITLPALAWFIT